LTYFCKPQLTPPFRSILHHQLDLSLLTFITKLI